MGATVGFITLCMSKDLALVDSEEVPESGACVEA